MAGPDGGGRDARPLVVVGAAGQLGETMAAALAERWPTLALTRHDLHLSDAAAVERRMREANPRAIINCAGYNQVDRAEDECEAAMEANAFAVLTLARAAAAVEATLVHFGSDFVFDGLATTPYRETDRPAPRSVYAASKLLGEWFAERAPRHYVLRVESLFGGLSRTKSSLDRIIEAVAAGGVVKVFVDRIVSPSYAWDIVRATANILERQPPAGVYHCVNTGSATWEVVAQEIRRLLGSTATLEPVGVADMPLPAARPQYCALSNQKLRDAGFDMPTWQDALARWLERRDRQRRRTPSA